jgi:hypothetical protein
MSELEKQIKTATSLLDNGKDWAMTRVMADYIKKAPQKNLTPVVINQATRKTKLALVMIPEWGVWFPPYNISRLSAVARKAGYQTSVYDVNIKAYHHMRNRLDYDPWDASKEWIWIGKWYHKELHPSLETLLMEYVERIVAEKPDVVGFSMYYTNEQPTNWVSREIRKRLPNCKIIVGGPQAPSMNKLSASCYNHIIEGEGEQVLLDILEKVEANDPIGDKYFKRNIKNRIDLDSLPFPDYSDYDMTEYLHTTGMSAEISRGCVAKCVFCTEVHFWKFRDRMSNRLLDEIEYQNKHYGLNFVWFIDSLVNGNLRELRGFCLGIVERNIKIKWQGYARCDGRMDLEYYKDLAASGCVQLNYGIESGSQRVLDAMKKEITIDEVEQNLADGAKFNIQAHTNWIVGFPNEDAEAFADTLTLMWRIKNYNILTISPGLSLMLSPGSEIVNEQEKFNIANRRTFLNMWTTNDLLNTKLHRLIRQKTLAIFLEHLNSNHYIYGFERPKLKDTYTIQYDKENIKSTIPRESFDYNIIKTDKGKFADSIMNEIWPVLRTLWRALGAYNIEIRFDPQTDLMEFGDRLACNYTANHLFSITKNGVWTANHNWKFKHADFDGKPDPNWDDCSFEYSWSGNGVW